jgi:hypothetical protein
MKIIDLNEARSSREAKVFSGRQRGKHWRREFELDRLDKGDETVVVLKQIWLRG